MDSTLKLVVFAMARSGSSSLLEILRLHPALHIAEEPFHPKYAQWNPGEKNYLDHIHDVPSLDQALAELFARFDGIKILQYQLPTELYSYLLRKLDLRIVFLRRKNLLRAAVSALIGGQTGVWKVWDLKCEIRDHYRDLAPLSIAELREIVEWLDEQIPEYERMVDRRPQGTYVKLVYEELYTPDVEANKRVLRPVFDMLGLAMPQTKELDRLLDPSSTKLNSEATYRLVPNAAEIDEKLGSDRTGWLFDNVRPR
jgi:hypothetical protein